MLPFVACQPSGQKAALARVGSEEWRCGSNRGQHRDFEDIELKAGHAEGTADRRWDGFTWVSTWKKFSHSGKGWHPRCWLPSPSEPLQVLGPNQLRVEGCGRSETRVQDEHSVPTEVPVLWMLWWVAQRARNRNSDVPCLQAAWSKWCSQCRHQLQDCMFAFFKIEQTHQKNLQSSVHMDVYIYICIIYFMCMCIAILCCCSNFKYPHVVHT